MGTEKSSTPGDFAAQFGDLVNRLSSSRENALSDMLAIQTGAQTLLQHEERRLAKKLGADHPRVQELRTRRLAQLESMQSLAIDREVAAIRVPAAKASEALVQGRVVDDQGRGIPGIRVYLADAGGKTVADSQTQTDSSGYYAIRLDPAGLPSEKTATVTFANAKKEVLQRMEKPLSIRSGVHSVSDVQMDRLELAGVKRPAPKAEPKKTEAETWEVSGKVSDEKGKGFPGLMVSVFDKDRKYDDKLGSALTDAEGRYRIVYRKQDFQEGPEAGADLYLTVIDAQGSELYTSQKAIRYNAGKKEAFDIRLKTDPGTPKKG